MLASSPASLIGMLTNDENTMTGRHAGIITRLVDCVDNNMLCIWCAPHQIHIVVKPIVEGIDNDVWVKQAYMFSVYLCVHDNLIIAMNIKSPKKTNHWAHLGCLLNFYKSYRRPLLEHTKNKRPNLMPSDQWWIITYALIVAINVTLAQL
jgi:hypothetical protein